MRLFIGFLLLFFSQLVMSSNVERIVVTGARIDIYDSPAVTLVKPADYLIQRIILTNDTRDQALRTKELHQTVKAMLRLANHKSQIEIAVGNEIIQPISLENFKLDLTTGDRPDTSVAFLYVKTPIRNDNTEALIDDLDKFIAGAKEYGRTEIAKSGELVLSIINPEKYRHELLSLIAQDLNKTIGIFGENYRAEVKGVSQSMMWERESISELRLYLEYDFKLISK